MAIPSQLNHYRVLEPLGKGGMGEVYVGEDTRLHRRVAIKVLSELVAADSERRQRFAREAQAVAALNHPNIVTIHSVEEDQGVPFIVMELVEGQTVGDLLARGRLPLDQLLRIATSVSEAIAAAHQRGITHRDLKPANIIVLPDGRVKVLDFGLAKLREAEVDPEGATRLPTSDLTGEGRIIGTVAYMSPEQAEGKPIDQRSDIFSLGVILHEMATGDRPFKGETTVSIISSILKDTPSSITDLNPSLPGGLAKIVRRALAKDPSRRYQTATDLRNDLEELQQELSATPTGAISGPRPVVLGRTRGRLVRGLIAVGLVVLVWALYQWRASRETDASFESARFTRLTNSGNAFLAAISGDGRYVVHVKFEAFRPSLWIRQTSTTSDVQIVPPAQVRYDGLTFSPDGDYVYYVTYGATSGVGTLFKIPVLGGAPQQILEDIDSRPSFSPDGGRFAFLRGWPARGRNYVMIANIDGSGAKDLATVEPPDQFTLSAVSWSPDDRTILTIGRSLRDGPHGVVFAVDATSAQSQTIGGRWAFVNDLQWMPDGRSFLVSAAPVGEQTAQLWQVTFPDGTRRRITNDVNAYTGVSVSADGRSIATVQAEALANIWVTSVDDPSKLTQVTSGRGRGDGASGLAWTLDGHIVFGSNASGRPEIWTADADGRNQHQLTNDPEPARAPAPSPDGRYITFSRMRKTGLFVMRMDADGSNVTQVTNAGADEGPVVSPDGLWVYFTSLGSGQPRPFKVAMDGGESTPLGEFQFRPVDVSPDGSTLLGTAWDQPQRRSDVATLPAEGGKPTMLNLPVLANPAWSHDGRSVTYLDVLDGFVNVWTRDVSGGTPRPLTRISGENIVAFAWSRDGRRLALARGDPSTDVVIISRQ